MFAKLDSSLIIAIGMHATMIAHLHMGPKSAVDEKFNLRLLLLFMVVIC